MKTTPIILSTISLIVALFALYEQSQTKDASHSQTAKKLVVVDFQDIYNAYRVQSNVDAELNAAISDANKALNVKREELGSLMEKIKSNQTALKQPDLKAEKLAEIKAAVSEQIQIATQLNQMITEQTQVVQQNVNKEALRINQSLYADLQRIIKRKAQSNGYHYVINAQAQDLTQTPIFLYSQETIDLTGELMKEMGLSPVRSASAAATPTIPAPKKESAPTPEATPAPAE